MERENWVAPVGLDCLRLNWTAERELTGVTAVMRVGVQVVDCLCREWTAEREVTGVALTLRREDRLEPDDSGWTIEQELTDVRQSTVSMASSTSK